MIKGSTVKAFILQVDYESTLTIKYNNSKISVNSLTSKIEDNKFYDVSISSSLHYLVDDITDDDLIALGLHKDTVYPEININIKENK